MLFVTQMIDAQFNIEAYNDLGRNNVSEGVFIKSAVSTSYRKGNTCLGYANLFDLKSHNPHFFSGAKVRLTRAFQIKTRSLEAKAFYMYNLLSRLIHEANWGVTINTESQHFSYLLGANFRTSHLTKVATENYELDVGTKLREKWNLMYRIAYSLKPNNNKWNTGVALTNVDHFLINQDTNPMLALHARYRLNFPLTLYTEAWYKTAGVFNISADSFGFFFRTGLQWELF